jgi:hypothetical protein
MPEGIFEHPLLIGYLGLGRGVLNGAAPADTIVRTGRSHPIGGTAVPVHRLCLDIRRPFTQNLGVDTFARQCAGNKHHLTFVAGNPLCLKVYRFNNETF